MKIYRGDITREGDIKQLQVKISELKKRNRILNEELGTIAVKSASCDSILNLFENALLIVSANGIIHKLNKGFSDLILYNNWELIGKSVDLLYRESDNAGSAVSQIIQSAVKSDHEYKVIFRKKDGSQLQTTISCHPISSRDSDIPLFCLILKKYADSREPEIYSSIIFNQTIDKIGIVDIKSMCFVLCNPALKSLIGFDEKVLYSKPVTDFIHPDDKEMTLKVIKDHLIKGETVTSFINRYLTHSGEIRYLKWNAQLLPDKQQIFAIAHDITAQHEYEKELEFQAMLLNNIQDRITATDLKGNITYVNEAVARSLGTTRESLRGCNVESFGDDPTQGASQKQIIKETLERGGWRGKVVNYTPSGDSILYDSRIQLYNNEDGEPEGMIGISTDITEMQKTINELKESKTKFMNVFEQGLVGQFIVDMDNLIIEANKSLCNLLGYSKEEIIGTCYLKYIYLQEESPLDQAVSLAKARENGCLELEIRLKHKDDYPIWSKVWANAVIDEKGNQIYAVVSLIDISELKKSRQAIQQSEELFRLIFNQSAVGISRISHQGSFLQVNPRFCRITGFSESELLEKRFLDLIDDQDFYKLFTLEDKFLKENSTNKTYEIRMLHPQKQQIWIKAYLAPVFDQQNNLSFFLVSIIDITEQKLNSQRLLELSTRLTLAVESADIGIWTYDPVTGIQQWDDKMKMLFGISDTESYVDIQLWYDLMLPEDRERMRNEIDNALRHHQEYKSEYRIRWRDNSIHYIRGFAVLLREKGKVVSVIGVNYDITEIRESELKIKNALEEKNMLIRELYHRTKNNMQVISSMLELESYNKSDEVKTTFKEMSNRIQAMALVHNRLYKSQNLSRIDLAQYIIELTAPMINSNQRSDLKIELETSFADVQVLLDAAIPCGLILNELISNSLKYAFINATNGKIMIKLSKEQELIHLDYADNGIGLPEGFDMANDRNLGLMLVQELTEGQLSGKLEYDSANGLAFHLCFSDSQFKDRLHE